MGDCQNYGPFLGPLIRPRIIIGTQKGTIILTVPHMCSEPTRRGCSDCLCCSNKIKFYKTLKPVHQDYRSCSASWRKAVLLRSGSKSRV